MEDAAVTAGGGLTSDVLQAKTQLAGAQARLIQFEGILATSNMNLNMFLIHFQII